MRLAYSTPMAATGLVLLGLAIFGRPDAYLREIRDQWDQFIDGASPEPGPDEHKDIRAPSDTGAIPSQVIRLQQQVKRLEDQLQANQPRSNPGTTQFSDPAPAVAPVTLEPDHHDLFKPAPVGPPTVAMTPPKIRRPAPPPGGGADDVQTVIGRLRQQSAGQAPPAPSDPALSTPSRDRLVQAQTALRSGRIEDARRLLQEVQVQLVFRPIAPDSNHAEPAGYGAYDVARALEALGSNDVAKGQDHIARALDDTAATTSRPPSDLPAYGSR